MKTLLQQIQRTFIKRNIILLVSLIFSLQLFAQQDTCKIPWVPPLFDVTETHWDEPQSFWQNGGHIPENVIDEDTTNYARAHIKATGSATLRVSDLDSTYAPGVLVGFYVKSRAFRDTMFLGVTITTYRDGVMQESYSGDHLWVEYVPFYVNDPICIGFVTTLPWNEIEIRFDTAGGRVHYDVFYAFMLGSCNEELPPLPITWLSFEVQKKGEASDLKWVTAQEFNNAGFHVERSADGRHFETIGSVAAADMSRSINEYTFQDLSPLYGMNYYRIRQTDLDGRINYSGVQFVSFSHDGELVKVWPNPAASELSILIPDEFKSMGEIKLVNAAGVIVMSRSIDETVHQTSLDLGSIEPGIYSVIIESPSVNQISKIIVLK